MSCPPLLNVVPVLFDKVNHVRGAHGVIAHGANRSKVVDFMRPSMRFAEYVPNVERRDVNQRLFAAKTAVLVDLRSNVQVPYVTAHAFGNGLLRAASFGSSF